MQIHSPVVMSKGFLQAVLGHTMPSLGGRVTSIIASTYSSVGTAQNPQWEHFIAHSYRVELFHKPSMVLSKVFGVPEYILFLCLEAFMVDRMMGSTSMIMSWQFEDKNPFPTKVKLSATSMSMHGCKPRHSTFVTNRSSISRESSPFGVKPAVCFAWLYCISDCNTSVGCLLP